MKSSYASTDTQVVFLRDLLVASVAFGLGSSMIQVAMVNRGWCFDNFIIRRIESNRGRLAARKSLWIGGTAMILLAAWTLLSPWLKKPVSESTFRFQVTPGSDDIESIDFDSHQTPFGK